MKNREQQIAREAGFQHHSALDESAQPDIAFQNDQRADMLPRLLIHREHHFVRLRGAEARPETEPVLPPDARQGAANLRLKEHNHRQTHIGNNEREQ